jgi:hypothetical protein
VICGLYSQTTNLMLSFDVLFSLCLTFYFLSTCVTHMTIIASYIKLEELLQNLIHGHDNMLRLFLDVTLWA